MSVGDESHTLALFEHPDSAVRDAEDELREFSDHELRLLLAFLDKVRAREQDYRWLKVFGLYEGVPLFKAEFNGRIAVFAVEDTKGEHVKVIIMFAGHRPPSPKGSGQAAVWDGQDDTVLLHGVVIPRCHLLFRPL